MTMATRSTSSSSSNSISTSIKSCTCATNRSVLLMPQPQRSQSSPARPSTEMLDESKRPIAKPKVGGVCLGLALLIHRVCLGEYGSSHSFVILTISPSSTEQTIASTGQTALVNGDSDRSRDAWSQIRPRLDFISTATLFIMYSA